MAESRFSFIKDDVLRQNLDEAFQHIIILLPFTESDAYDETAKSAFRKTIIIYTASIIEALLFNLLDNKFTEEDIADFYSSWNLKNKKVLYTVEDGSHKIVAGDYKKIPGKTSKRKMNLGMICSFLKEKEILSIGLFDDVNEITKLRNSQHISTHRKVKSYSKNEIEKAFSVASKIKNFVKDRI